MNIFVLDLDIHKCAEYHCDKHVVKMIVEYTQLLCNAYSTNGYKAPYKPTHINHPCSIWVRRSRENFLWLLNLTLELIEQYSFRYGKNHKTFEVTSWCLDNIDILEFESTELTSMPQCMDESYKIASDKLSDVCTAYRNYYIGDKIRFAKYRNVDVPSWLSTSKN